MNDEAALYGFLIQTTEGVMTPPAFLEEVFEIVWPDNADNVDFSLVTDTAVEVSVTYVIEPFGVVKTVDYIANLAPGELKLSCGDVFSIAKNVEVGGLASDIGDALYEDFILEALI